MFLDFISYSNGPLAEDLLPQIDGGKCPVLIAWGEKDPWEPINDARRLYGSQPCVEEFITLPNVGCDEPQRGGGACPVVQPLMLSGRSVADRAQIVCSVPPAGTVRWCACD